MVDSGGPSTKKEASSVGPEDGSLLELAPRKGSQDLASSGTTQEKGTVARPSFEELYDDFSAVMDLLGPSYEAVRKATFYSVLGEVIKGGDRDDNGVVAVDAWGWSESNRQRFSSIEYRRTLDTRLHLRVFIYPGRGKKQVEEIFKKAAKAVNHSIRSPDSFHAEQFVGKVLTRPTVEELEIKLGFLAYDILLINEAKSLWTQRGHEDTRKHIRTACDPIGENDIEKENVDAPMGNEVHYYPSPTTVLLSQPWSLDFDLIALGDLRRGPIVYVPRLSQKEEADIDAMFHNLAAAADAKASRKLFRALNGFAAETPHHWNLRDSSAEVEIYHRELKGYARALAAGNVSAEAYVEAAGFDILYWLLKMVCIRAAVAGRNEPSHEDFLGAMEDLKFILKSSIEFVRQFVASEGRHLEGSVDKEWRFLELAWKYRGHKVGYVCKKASDDPLMNQGRSVSLASVVKHYYYKQRKEGLISTDPKAVKLTDEGRKKIDVD